MTRTRRPQQQAPVETGIETDRSLSNSAWNSFLLPTIPSLVAPTPPPDLGPLDAERASLESRIAATEASLATARASLGSARDALGAARAQLGSRSPPGEESTPEDRTTYEQWLAGARAAVSAAEARVSGLEAEVDHLASEVSALRGELATVEDRRAALVAQASVPSFPLGSPLLAQLGPIESPQDAVVLGDNPPPQVCLDLPEGREEALAAKATELGRVLNQTGDPTALLEVVADFESPAEVDEFLRAYNEHHQVALPGETLPPTMTRELLLQKAAQILPDAKQFTLFEAQMSGDPQHATREGLRLATNDYSLEELAAQNQRFASNRGLHFVDPSTPWWAHPVNPVMYAGYRVYDGLTRELPTEVNRLTNLDPDQGLVVESLARLAPAQRAAFFANPENRALLDRAGGCMTSDADRIRFAAFEHTGDRLTTALAEVKQTHLDRAIEDIRLRKLKNGDTTELTAAERAEAEGRVADLPQHELEAEADRKVAVRTDADLAAADLWDARTGTKVFADLGRVQAALDRARTDPEFQRQFLETYAASRGEVLGPDGQPLTPMQLLERDVSEAAHNSLATQGFAVPLGQPVAEGAKQLLLGADAARSQRNADVALTTVQQLVADDRFEATGDKLNTINRKAGLPNLDATSVKLVLFQAKNDPAVAEGLKRIGLALEDVEAYAQHLGRAEASNRAARITEAAHQGNLTRKDGLLDQLENRALTEAKHAWQDDRRRYDPASDPDGTRWKRLLAKKEFLDQLHLEQKGLLDEEMRRRHGMSTTEFVRNNQGDQMVQRTLVHAFEEGKASEHEELFLSLTDKNVTRIQSIYAGKTREQIVALERRYGEDITSKGFGWSLDNLLGTNGFSTERPLDGRGLGASDLVLIQAMRAGDPRTIYDPENPPADPSERQRLATLRRRLEEQIAAARYRNAQAGWLRGPIDAMESATREQASNDLAEANQRRLDAFRTTYQRELDGGDPRAWAEYAKLDRIVVSDLQTKHDYESRVVRNTTFVLEVIGATAATAATMGGASPYWLVVIAAATEVFKASAEHLIRPEGLSTTETSQKVVGLVMETALALGGAHLGRLASAKDAATTLRAVDAFVNRYGTLDAVKSAAKNLLEKGPTGQAFEELKNAVGTEFAMAILKSLAGPAGNYGDVVKNQVQASLDDRKKRGG